MWQHAVRWSAERAVATALVQSGDGVSSRIGGELRLAVEGHEAAQAFDLVRAADQSCPTRDIGTPIT